MNSYSCDSTFACDSSFAVGDDSFTSGPLAFDDDSYKFEVARPSLYRELMEEEERFLEEHDDCEDVELFSDAWLHRPASLLDELRAAGEVDFFFNEVDKLNPAETLDVSQEGDKSTDDGVPAIVAVAKEGDLQVKSVARSETPVMSAVAAKVVSRIPRLAGPVRTRITSPIRAPRAASNTTIPRSVLRATTAPAQAKVLPAQSKVPQPKVVATKGSNSATRGACKVASTTRPALRATVAPAQPKAISISRGTTGTAIKRPALKATVAPAQASVERKAPVSLANRTSLAPQKKRADRA